MAKTHINLGIETCETGLKLALYDSKAKKILRTEMVAMSENPLLSVTHLEEALWPWLLQVGSPTLALISVSLPAFQGVIRDIRIPSDTDSIDGYIRWELESSLSTSLDEYYYGVDFYPDSKNPQGALVAAYRRTLIDSLRTGFSNKKLAPSIIEPDLFALLNLLEYADSVESGMHCIVKADRAGILVFWGNGHALGPVRWCPTGSLGIDPDSVVMPQLAENVYRILVDGFTNITANKPQVRMCGDLAAHPMFIELMNQKASEFELILWDSFLKISLDADGNTPQSVLACIGAIGVAVGGNRK